MGSTIISTRTTAIVLAMTVMGLSAPIVAFAQNTPTVTVFQDPIQVNTGGGEGTEQTQEVEGSSDDDANVCIVHISNIMNFTPLAKVGRCVEED